MSMFSPFYLFASEVGIELEISEDVSSSMGINYSIRYRDKNIAILFSDFFDPTRSYRDIDGIDIYLKYQYSYDEKYKDNVYPIGPPSGITSKDDYDNYHTLCDQQIYKATGNIVVNRQVPYRNALKRRSHVQRLLRFEYGDYTKTRCIPQLDYWKSFEKCLVSVTVPGAHNDMLDRGHIQQMGLGVCTIAPQIKTLLPFKRRLIPNEHYLKCESDYSDLISLVEWCKNNRKKCREIGRNAKSLYDSSYAPSSMFTYIDEIIEETK